MEAEMTEYCFSFHFTLQQMRSHNTVHKHLGNFYEAMTLSLGAQRPLEI